MRSAMRRQDNEGEGKEKGNSKFEPLGLGTTGVINRNKKLGEERVEHKNGRPLSWQQVLWFGHPSKDFQ
jgi:hypothetical protein